MVRITATFIDSGVEASTPIQAFKAWNPAPE